MNTEILFAIAGVLLVFGWINAAKYLRQNEGDWIMLDESPLFPILNTILILVLLFSLIVVWVNMGFVVFLKTLGVTVGGVFVGLFAGFILSRILGKEGFAIIVQIIAAIASVVYLLIKLF